MGKVSDRILSEASEKSGQVADEYLRKAESMRAVYDEAWRGKKEENEEKLRELYDSEMKRLISVRRLEMKKRILAEKRELLRKLAVKAGDIIRGDPELYKRFIEIGIIKGVVTGTEEIVISETDRGIFSSEFIEHLNSAASGASGFECSLKLSGITEDTGGGLHLREGRINFNATVDVTINAAAEELESGLAAMLFGGG